MNENNWTIKDLLDNSADKYADRMAIGFVGGEPITYKHLKELVADFQAMLREHGVGPQDRVAIISENMPNWTISYFAITTMGAIAVPILQEFHASAVHHILRHSEAKVVIVSDRYLEKVEGETFPALKTTIRMNDFTVITDEDEVEEKVEETKTTNFTEAVEAAREKIEILNERARKLTDRMDEETMKKVSEAVDTAWDKFEILGDRARKLFDRKKATLPAAALAKDDVAVILYTSGTTGHSKGVVLSHDNLVSSVLAGVKTIPVYETDRFLSVLPLSHTYESTVCMLVPIHCGSSIHYLQRPPTPTTLLPAMQKIKPTVIGVVPLIIEKIYLKRIKPKLNRKGVVGSLLKIGPARRQIAKIAGKKLIEAFGGELRCMCIGGAALAPEVEKFLYDAEIPYAIGYGMTETAPLLAGTRPGRQRLRGVGPALPGVELKILDPDPETGEGEIIAKGPNIMREYYKAPKITAETFTEDGWLLTGDLGAFDEDGYIYIKGRLKNVIIGPSGENIYPEEVESIINTCDFVLESLVYESEGKLVARIHLNYDALDEKFDVSQMIASEVREKVSELLESTRLKVNSKVSTFARLAKVYEQVEPFEKTPTQKIKRFLYLAK